MSEGFPVRHASPSTDAVSIVAGMEAARTVLERVAPRAGDGLL